jgi:hypothetical protein
MDQAMDQEKIENDVKHLMASSANFFTSQKITAQKVREESKKAYGSLLDAHMLTIGAIQSALLRHNSIPGKTSEQISNIFSLVASFMMGVDICESAISEGYYLQACAILKQEMEALAAIEECWKNQRKEKATPNVKYIRWNLSRFYGDLNRAAHVADKDLLSYVLQATHNGQAVPASITPIFNQTEAKGLYGLHVAFLIQLSFQLDKLYVEVYGDGLTDVERMGVARSFHCLLDEGWLKKGVRKT